MTAGERPPSDEQDDVAMLIRLAGRDAAVPADRRARVEAAVHARWRQEVSRRTRVRRVWIGGALAVATGLAVAIVSFSVRREGVLPEAARPILQVEYSVGTPSILGPGGDDSAPRMGVVLGATIATNARSLVALRHEAGGSVRVDASSRVRVVAATVLALDEGAVYVDSRPASPPAPPLTIRTPLGDVEEVGTQFEVRLVNDAVRVRVREGSVLVRDGDRSRRVPVRSEIRLAADGTSTTLAIETHGPDWGWLARVVPAPEIEGLTAGAFLEWAAREGGWTMRFADEDLARSASTTVLSGSVRGLTLDEALNAVLPTCRMTHRIENGTLVVDETPR